MTILHEEYSHAMDNFTGEKNTMSEDHGQFFNVKAYSSPTVKEVMSKPEYKNSVAYKSIKEIRAWIKKNKKNE